MFILDVEFSSRKNRWLTIHSKILQTHFFFQNVTSFLLIEKQRSEMAYFCTHALKSPKKCTRRRNCSHHSEVGISASLSIVISFLFPCLLVHETELIHSATYFCSQALKSPKKCKCQQLSLFRNWSFCKLEVVIVYHTSRLAVHMTEKTRGVEKLSNQWDRSGSGAYFDYLDQAQNGSRGK